MKESNPGLTFHERVLAELESLLTTGAPLTPEQLDYAALLYSQATEWKFHLAPEVKQKLEIAYGLILHLAKTQQPEYAESEPLAIES